jgi:hypothetical protein
LVILFESLSNPIRSKRYQWDFDRTLPGKKIRTDSSDYIKGEDLYG